MGGGGAGVAVTVEPGSRAPVSPPARRWPQPRALEDLGPESSPRNEGHPRSSTCGSQPFRAVAALPPTPTPASGPLRSWPRELPASATQPGKRHVTPWPPGGRSSGGSARGDHSHAEPSRAADRAASPRGGVRAAFRLGPDRGGPSRKKVSNQPGVWAGDREPRAHGRQPRKRSQT